MITEIVKKLNELFNNKVYPTNAPEGEITPYLVYFNKETELKTLEGYDGLYTSNIVLNIMTKTFSEANIKIKILKNMLKELNNKIGAFSIQEVAIEETEIVYENQLNLYRGIVPITVYFKED